jgi:hypothetical protein
MRTAGLRPAADKLAAVTAIVDQLAWTTIPRTITITADDGLLRRIIVGVIQNTLMDFSLLSDDGTRPDVDLDHYQQLTDHRAALTDLLRSARPARRSL